MRTPVFVALEGPEFAGIQTNPNYPRVISEVLATTRPMVRLTLGNRESLMFAVPATADMRALMTARRVIKLTPPGEYASEWLVSRVVEIVAPGNSPALAVECDPIWAIMGDVGIIEQVFEGGQSFANLGGINGTAANYLATYVIPALQRRNVSWIELGQVDPTLQFDLSWDSQTPLQVLNTVTSITGAEWELERDEAYSRYLINVVDRIGSSAPVVRVREGLNVLQVDAQRTREKLYTAIRPQGDLETGGEERANIGFASWRVKSKTSDTLQLEAHGGGIGPVLEDGQHVGLYLEALGGDLREIVSTTAPDLIELESGGGADFDVGDDAMIVADDDGTLITELTSPSGIAAFGYVQGVIQRKALGYRNWVRNPFMTNGIGSAITGVRCRISATGSNSFAVEGLPAGTTWAPGDFIASNGRLWTVANSGTASGSFTGTVDVVESNTGSTSVAGISVLGKNRLSSLPDLYDESNGSLMLPFTGNGGLVITGQLDGAQNFNALNPARQTLVIDNMPANTLISAGSSINIPTADAQGLIVEDVTTNSSGAATAKVWGINGNLSNNATFTIYSPPAPIGYTGYIQVRLISKATSTEGTLSQTFRLREIPGFTKARATIEFGGVGPTAWPGPKAELYFDGNLEDSAFAVDELSGSGTRARKGTVRLDFDVDDDEDADIVVYFGAGTTGAMRNTTYCSGVQVTLCDDENVPIVEGSAATPLFQAGQLALAASRQWPTTYSATVEELASAWDLPSDSPAFNLGAYIHLVASSAGIDALLRVTEVNFDPFDPKVKTVILDTDPDRITQITAKQRTRPIFVNVDVQVDDDGRARETVLASDAPPVIVSGVNRFVVPGGTTSANDELTVEILP
jgi:hypothetical protein